MDDSIALAEHIGQLLTARKETVAIAESSAGGLISAALLAIPESALEGIRPSTEPYARLLARTARTRFGSTWSIAETGATGPTGNRYGDAAGHACIAIAGPVEDSRTLETGSADRLPARIFSASLHVDGTLGSSHQ